MVSDIVRLRQQIADEYLACQQGLSGLALGTSQHQFITARMENIERCRKELVGLVGDEEAIKIFIGASHQVQQESEVER